MRTNTNRQRSKLAEVSQEGERVSQEGERVSQEGVSQVGERQK